MYDRTARCLKDSKRLIDFAGVHRHVAGQPFSFAGHRYLETIYGDEAPFIVIRKAAQMGASEYGITRALYFAITYDGRVIYFFPTDHDVGQFSRDRFAPAIAESAYLAGLVRDTDTAGLKQIGRGSVYLRGLRSRTQLKSVPADFLIFDELDEMDPAKVELARARLGHSSFGYELYLSTPSFPLYGIDAAFEATDQRHWLLRCDRCATYRCLEDEFTQTHGRSDDPRREIVFVKGPPGAETLVCTSCGGPLDPAHGLWVPKYPERSRHGYHLSKFTSVVVSAAEREAGCQTKPAALLRKWQETAYPQEFFNSELGLPYLSADGGLCEADLLALVGDYPQSASGKGCVMGVDQGNGLHIVIKERRPDGNIVFTLRVKHQEITDATFTHLDQLMKDYDVRVCVIDALPHTHAARAFAGRFRGRVYLAYYGDTQKGLVDWGYDKENTPTATINRTDAFDAMRDVHQKGDRRIPRLDDGVREFIRQMTNIVRKVEEDPVSGQKKARWVRRCRDDHYAHADCYAEVALRRLHRGVRASIISAWGIESSGWD